MRSKTILREYSHEKTLDRFRQPLNKALTPKREGAGLRSLGFYDLGTDDAGTAVLLFFEKMDPTKKKAYVLLMVKWFLDGSMKLLEDVVKLKPVIVLVDKFRNTLTGVDFKTMSFDQFLDLGDKLSSQVSNSEASKAEEEYFYNDGQAVKFYDGPDMKIIKPVTEAAAKYFGRGTRWCTAAEEDNMFTYYAKQGEIYCILFKGENRRWQFHFETEQFMDEQDRPVDESSSLFKSVLGHFQLEIENRLWPHVSSGATMPYSALKYVIDPPRELIIDIVSDEGTAIKYVKPELRDDDIWYAALDNDWRAMESCSPSPASDIAMFAIQKNPNVIQYFVPNEEEQVLAVSIDPEVVYLMDRWGIEVCAKAAMIAVKKSGRLIRYCGKQPADVQIAAFQEDRAALSDTVDQTPQLISYAIESNPRNIIYVKKSLLTDAFKMQALQKDKRLINMIANPTKEMYALAGVDPRR